MASYPKGIFECQLRKSVPGDARFLSEEVGVNPMNRAAQVLTALISVLNAKNRSFTRLTLRKMILSEAFFR